MSKISNYLEFYSQALQLRSKRNEVLASNISVLREKLLFRDPINPSFDGNTVEMEVEQMEFSENVIRYQTTLQFLNGRITGLMSAIRGE
jgi:flagellar basal-body rod protein FlgB